VALSSSKELARYTRRVHEELEVSFQPMTGNQGVAKAMLDRRATVFDDGECDTFILGSHYGACVERGVQEAESGSLKLPLKEASDT
jgi:hypothetical protein